MYLTQEKIREREGGERERERERETDRQTETRGDRHRPLQKIR